MSLLSTLAPATQPTGSLHPFPFSSPPAPLRTLHTHLKQPERGTVRAKTRALPDNYLFPQERLSFREQKRKIKETLLDGRPTYPQLPSRKARFSVETVLFARDQDEWFPQGLLQDFVRCEVCVRCPAEVRKRILR